MSDPLTPYAHLYKDVAGPGDGRPTALQVISDNVAKDAWTGRVALVTGGTSGIGIETIRALHATGADVFFTARDLSKAEKSRADILGRSSGKGRIEFIEMDMDSLDSVRQAAREFLSKSSKLNVLVNNAGIMACPETKTVDGFERQFGVNHLAHYLLTRLLLPALIETSAATPEFNSRVVNVSSSAHRMGEVRLDDYNFDKPDSYQPWLSYGQSKTANIWMANYLDRVLGAKGVHAYSLHPGGIKTGLAQYLDEETRKTWDVPEFAKQFINVEQGAATSTWAAVGKALEGKGGLFLECCGAAGPLVDPSDLFAPGSAPHAFDAAGEKTLWELSAKLVGVDKDI